MPLYCASQTNETPTAGCGAVYGSQRCHETRPPFATAAEAEAIVAASTSTAAAGSTARGTRLVVSPASTTRTPSRIRRPTTSEPALPRKRCRPAGAGEHDERGDERAPRRDGERERDDEAEDRREDRAAHLRVHARVERRLHVVEVEEAVAERVPTARGKCRG